MSEAIMFRRGELSPVLFDQTPEEEVAYSFSNSRLRSWPFVFQCRRNTKICGSECLINLVVQDQDAIVRVIRPLRLEGSIIDRLRTKFEAQTTEKKSGNIEVLHHERIKRFHKKYRTPKEAFLSAPFRSVVAAEIAKFED